MRSQEGFSELLPQQVGDDSTAEFSRARVTAPDQECVIKDDHTTGNGVKEHLPFARGPFNFLKQARVHDGHGHVISQALQHPGIVLRERLLPVDDGDSANGTVRGHQGGDHRPLDLRQPLHGARRTGITPEVVGNDQFVFCNRLAHQTRGHRQVHAGQHVGCAHRRDDVQVLVLAKRDARAFGAKQRDRVPKDQPKHLAEPQGLTDRARDIREGLGLPTFPLAFRISSGVRHRGRGLRAHRGQHLLVVDAEHFGGCGVNYQHPDQLYTGEEWDGQHRRGGARIAHHIIRRQVRCQPRLLASAIGIAVADAHRSAGARDLGDNAIAQPHRRT